MEGRLWGFKIPQYKSWTWPEIKFLRNCIKIQTHFIQEGNCHNMWDTTGKTNKPTINFPRLAVVPYVEVEWISKGKKQLTSSGYGWKR